MMQKETNSENELSSVAKNDEVTERERETMSHEEWQSVRPMAGHNNRYLIWSVS